MFEFLCACLKIVTSALLPLRSFLLQASPRIDGKPDDIVLVPVPAFFTAASGHALFSVVRFVA